MQLRYGMNPHQALAHAVPVTRGAWPVRAVHGQPSFINMLDAVNGWQLVFEVSRALGKPAAASIKHLSPAGAAVAGPVDEVTAQLGGIDDAELSDVASAYLRAHDGDPRSSFGEFAAVSDQVDDGVAELLTEVVSDGIIAPGYAPGTVARLSRKKDGRFLIMEADPGFTPPETESREMFGLRLSQDRDRVRLTPELLRLVTGEPLPATAIEDLLLGLAVVRYTQSNSVCYVRDGMTLGVGAGQQSRVDCTRLAGAKTDAWWLRRHPAIRSLAFLPSVRRHERVSWQTRVIEGDLTPAERRQLAQILAGPGIELFPDQRADWMRRLTGVAFVSDGYLPFRDNIDLAHRHGVRYIAEPGGSVRADDVADACREHGITLARTGVRLFRH